MARGLQTVSSPFLCLSSQSSGWPPVFQQSQEYSAKAEPPLAWGVTAVTMHLAAPPAWPWTVTPELPHSMCPQGLMGRVQRTAICVHKRSALRNQLSAPCTPTGWPRASHLCSLGHHFIVCKMEIKRENVEPSAPGPNSVFIIRGKGYWKN